MIRLGTGLAKEAVEWSALSTKVCEPKELCQETLLLIDVGVWDETRAALLHQASTALPWVLCPAVPAHLLLFLGLSCWVAV